MITKEEITKLSNQSQDAYEKYSEALVQYRIERKKANLPVEKGDCFYFNAPHVTPLSNTLIRITDILIKKNMHVKYYYESIMVGQNILQYRVQTKYQYLTNLSYYSKFDSNAWASILSIIQLGGHHALNIIKKEVDK